MKLAGPHSFRLKRSSQMPHQLAPDQEPQNSISFKQSGVTVDAIQVHVEARRIAAARTDFVVFLNAAESRTSSKDKIRPRHLVG